SYMRAGDNQHMSNFDIAVAPEYRQQGVAKSLLPIAAQFAREQGKRLMMGWTSSLIPAGEAFMRRVGAQLGQPMHTNDLDLTAVDRDLMRRWIAQGEMQREFTLGMWRGAIPDEDIETVCQLVDVMNSMPRDDLDMEDWHLTPEQLRSWERVMAARRDERWMLYARHVPSGEVAGFTEIVYNANRPDRVEQGGTGVWHRYRNLGLGRWLKAAMVEYLLAERPQVTKIRTGNAHSNAPMLKINFEMGFKPHHSEYRWQVATDTVFDYLAQQREPALA
ncbi:MAG: GNAT family N-acetyltransferase, partial [Chloroflexi bacterium]|nr:GNAT family N-acetyltransferase [Chloroflexota bacterium]